MGSRDGAEVRAAQEGQIGGRFGGGRLEAGWPRLGPDWWHAQSHSTVVVGWFRGAGSRRPCRVTQQSAQSSRAVNQAVSEWAAWTQHDVGSPALPL